MDPESPANILPTDNLQLRGPCGSECVGLVSSTGESHLVAIRSIAANERLFILAGETSDRPTRHSLQIGWQLHLEADAEDRPAGGRDRYLWRFLNHSCDPNALIRGREVRARRAIAPGEAVTFDYNTTEWEMAGPFACRCGAPACLGTIRGFKHLTPAQRARLAPYVADHLRPYLPDGAKAADSAPPS